MTTNYRYQVLKNDELINECQGWNEALVILCNICEESTPNVDKVQICDKKDDNFIYDASDIVPMWD